MSKNKNNWAPEDCCLACKGHGCGDCGNTGLESEALSHGCHKVVRDSHNLPHIVDTLTGYALGPAGRFVADCRTLKEAKAVAAAIGERSPFEV